MSARFCLLIVQLGLVALILSPRQLIAQGIGLPGQSGTNLSKLKLMRVSSGSKKTKPILRAVMPERHKET